MNNRLRLPSFPPPEKQDIIRFHVLKRLSYSTRMMLFSLLLLAGFTIQVLTYSVWPGAVFLVCAVVLVLVRGYDSRVRLKNFKPDSRWTPVDMGKIRQIEEMDDRVTKWDRDILDITNAAGFVTFLLTFFALVLVDSVTNMFKSRTGVIFATDGMILLLPMWFNGIRRILKQGNLRVKVDIIKQLEEYFRTVKKEGENFVPALLLARDKTGKSVPVDCKFTVTFDGMPSDFYGIQAQINMNVVEGTSYPYFYCVIAAKLGFGLPEYFGKITAPKDNITIEIDVKENVEVIIIRQTTTRTSGYHTKINACKRILGKALVEARMILEDKHQKNYSESGK